MEKWKRIKIRWSIFEKTFGEVKNATTHGIEKHEHFPRKVFEDLETCETKYSRMDQGKFKEDSI